MREYLSDQAVNEKVSALGSNKSWCVWRGKSAVEDNEESDHGGVRYLCKEESDKRGRDRGEKGRWGKGVGVMTAAVMWEENKNEMGVMNFTR